jgi:ketosteroid isomerase-like protein
MAPENLEIPRRAIEAYGRGDIPGFLELLDEDVEWIPIMATLEGRVYRGHEGVRQWLDDLANYWEYFEPRYEEYRDLGDRVLVLGSWRARGRVSGVVLDDQPGTWLFEIKDGKVARMQTFTDREEGLEAAGLPT